MKLFVLSSLFCMTFGMPQLDFTFLGSNPKMVPRRCRSSILFSKIHVDCYKCELEEIPSNLRSDVQVLVLTFNRIRKLDNKNLAPYDDLIELYLYDNAIATIETDTFAHQQELQLLDLARNGLFSFPVQIFELPNLKTLYLSMNHINEQFLENIQNIVAPLEILSLVDNELTRIPRFQIPLTTLHYLNVSRNKIDKLSTEDLAPYCSLKTLDVTDNPIKFDPKACDCEILKAWIDSHKIVIKPSLPCEGKGNKCEIRFSNETLSLHNNCHDTFRARIEKEKTRAMWKRVAIILSIVVVGISIVLFCTYTRLKKRRRKMEEQKEKLANKANIANTELLDEKFHT